MAFVKKPKIHNEKPELQEWQLIPKLFGNIHEDFQSHLDLLGNDRILFSSRFGTGKTTFLNHFFNLKESKKNYNVFHLYPVNYSVLTNEDIFKYIKFDILYEMIDKEILLGGSNLDFLKSESSFIREEVFFFFYSENIKAFLS